MKKLTILLTLMALGSSFGLLTGCASITGGTTQSVSVETPPTKDATCALTNNRGRWYVSNTPGTVYVHRSKGDLTVECQKEGYHNATTTIKSSTRGAIAGNLIGGLVGGPVGAGVDMADGAAFAYQPQVVVPMEKAYAGSVKGTAKKKPKKSS